MRAKTITPNQRALCALIALATNDRPRSRGSVASGNPSALRLGKPLRLATRVGSCPTVCGGRRCGRCPCPTPLPIGSLASISIKGEGFARHPLPFALAALPCAAASGVALDTDSSHDVGHGSNVDGNKKPGAWCWHQIKSHPEKYSLLLNS